MYAAVDFQNQSMLDAEEINHVPVNYMLSSELESEHSAVTQDVPRERFRHCRAVSEDSRAVSLPKGDSSPSGHSGKIGNLSTAE
jgi:hypothetical protein